MGKYWYYERIRRAAERAAERKRLGQIALAQKLGVGKSIISLWETGACEPTLSNLIKIAKFFGVSIDYLAGLES